MTLSHRRLVIAAAIAIVLALASLLLPTSPGHSANRAWLDKRATESSAQAVSDIARALFTVTPGTVATVRAAAKKDLSGKAVAQYDKLYGPVLDSARSRPVTLTTDIRALGVTRLTESSAELLLIADQTATAGAQSQAGEAQLRLTAAHDAHGWTIASITVL